MYLLLHIGIPNTEKQINNGIPNTDKSGVANFFYTISTAFAI